MNKSLLFSLLILAMLVCNVNVAQAASRTVCGGLIGCDYTTIQAAINASSDGDLILVLDNTHTEAGIFVNKDVVIRGNGMSTTTVQAAPTASQATNRVFEISDDTTLSIHDLTIASGRTADGTAFVIDGGNGGGILNRGHLTLHNVRVSNNETGNGFDCAVDSCTAGNGGDGAGIYNAVGAHLIVIRSEIMGNESADGAPCSGSQCNVGAGGDGAGIYNAGQLQLIKSTINANENGQEGDCFSGNCNTGNVDYGGAIYNSGFAHIRNSTLHGNLASNGGGIATVGSAETTLSNVTITENNTRVLFQQGGGIYNENRTFIFNGVVADNTGDQCGGTANVAASGENLASDATCSNFTVSGAPVNLRGFGNYGDVLAFNPPDWDSPAYNRGGDCEVTDQRGLRRLRDGGGCDLGAVEKIVHSFCRTVNTPLPDNSPFTENDLVTVNQTGSLIDVQPHVTITHPYVADLFVQLRHSGSFDLVDRPGIPGNACTGDDVAASFFDGASSSAETSCNVTSPALQGGLIPNQPLAPLVGEPLNGEWIMEVGDFAVGDEGTWVGWCLDAEYEPEIAADTLTQFTVSASQLRIGPDDSFYYRVDVTTGSSGWAAADGTLFTFDANVADIDGGAVISGTPTVPNGSNINCTRPGGVGTFFRCDGDAGAMLAANSTFTFFFPYTNPSDVSGCGIGRVNGLLREENMTNLDLLARPECVASTQGSTFPPTTSVPTAVSVAESTAQSTGKHPALLFFMLLATWFVLRFVKLNSDKGV